ncbi:MAG: GTP-binding protein [Candidatus Lokiarchaeota archaeon]|nr:GTP-binding protein [Candidatus Lokiarchaeota archaeon]
MSKEKFKEIFKIIVLGAAGVGKTTLIEQFSDKSLHEDVAPKVGVNFFIKNVNIDGHDYKLQFWDIIDDDKFGSLQTLYYTGASAVFFMFDLSRPETFDYYQTRFKEVWNQARQDKCLVLIIGNKIDLVKNLEAIDSEKYRKFVKKEGLLGYIELTSTNNIDDLLKQLPIIIQKALKKSYQVKFLVTSKELEEIKRFVRLSHQTQSEFIRTAIWEKIRLINTPSMIENSIKNKEIVKDTLRLDELKKIRELLERSEE